MFTETVLAAEYIANIFVYVLTSHIFSAFSCDFITIILLCTP